jgi:hypothetical protein
VPAESEDIRRVSSAYSMQVALAVDWPFGCWERLSNLSELRELGNVARDYLPGPWAGALGG